MIHLTHDTVSFQLNQPRALGTMHTRATCYYVGNAQGGPAHSHNTVESVIEGNVLQYGTSTLFSPEFDFDESFCITPA